METERAKVQDHRRPEEGAGRAADCGMEGKGGQRTNPTVKIRNTHRARGRQRRTGQGGAASGRPKGLNVHGHGERKT